MKYLTRISVLALIAAMCLAVPGGNPKEEFRGVWLSTVANIDWPESRLDPEAKKQADLIRYLDLMKETGINALVFQVRPSCDAMYPSPYEPWSYWFSGTQGEGPAADSLWDPLAFAVEEAHKRGMELHAWVNPYRAVVNPLWADSAGYLSDRHISRQRPDWLLKFSSVCILDPGKAEVRDYITKIFMDIVTRYDIDGLHMDDYFYPYSPIKNEDSLTFAEESRGFTDLHDWRRDNINLLVARVADSIRQVKPWVKWGISPFGIYKPGVPKGIEGFDAWSVLYCDPLAWLEAGTVDYITPQCYWPFGGGQDYGTLIPWWAGEAKKHKRHFYPGQALYRAASDKFPVGEIPRQVRMNRQTEGCQGSIYFTANNFFKNPKNTTDSLRLDLYATPALWPVFDHKKSKPLAPPAVFAERSSQDVTLSWESGPGAWGYVVYRSRTQHDLISDPASILAVLPAEGSSYRDETSEQWFYAVTALNDYKLESRPGRAVMEFVVPQRPVYGAQEKCPWLVFKWNPYAGADDYHIQVAADKDFSFIVYEERLLSKTRLNKTLPRGLTYYWRVKANNTENWSPVWTFVR
ncbi:MAG: family 10 glycosylhydrolase [Candidatus Marinimicrobia bacterium]|nr:family 10 glycosylhydrolase [Candidatus Neomarinimicrobiota bacterium]